jgi:hypothetical protein
MVVAHIGFIAGFRSQETTGSANKHCIGRPI